MRGMEGGVCGGVGEGKYMFCTLRLHSKIKDLWYMYVWCLRGVG